jgi:uncharacterized protein
MKNVIAAAFVSLIAAVTASSSTAQPAIGPSFDCARVAPGTSKATICESKDISILDRELARVYLLAVNATIGKAQEELKAMERGWIKSRDECWKAADQNDCVLFAYVDQIATLRAMSKAARADQGRPLVTGPDAMQCPDTIIRLTRVALDPPLLHLRYKDRVFLMRSVRTASGARYQSTTKEGSADFWSKGGEAQLALDGGPPQTCKVVRVN